jgi:ABC-type multidrug transport system fused ATPase/permease subunit
LTSGEHIALGRPAASQQEIETAAHFACIHEDILRFPQAYNTMVGERGVTLSGGQKQRLAIARALLMQAKIVILDDALSAVDVLTEKKILDNFRQKLLGHSLLIVSHRLTAVEKADQIIVLQQQGQPSEIGTHEELIALDGWYAQIYRYQQIEQAVLDGR